MIMKKDKIKMLKKKRKWNSVLNLVKIISKQYNDITNEIKTRSENRREKLFNSEISAIFSYI
jgi:hypothetical protein